VVVTVSMISVIVGIVVVMTVVVVVAASVSNVSVVTYTVSPMIEMSVFSTGLTITGIGSVTVAVASIMTMAMVVIVDGSVAVGTVVAIPTIITSTVAGLVIIPVSMMSTSATISGPRSVTVTVTCWMTFAHVATIVVAMSHVSVIVVSMIVVVVVIVIIVSVVVVIGIMDSLRYWIVLFVVIVIVFKAIIVLRPVVSFIWITVIRVVLVRVGVKVTVVVVLTAFSAPVFITDTVSSFVEMGVVDALNAVVCTRSSATVAAFVAAVVSGLGTRSDVIHASWAAPEVVAFTLAVCVLRGVSDTMFAVVLGSTSAAIADVIAGTLVKVTCGSAPIIITKTSGLVVPMCVPSALNTSA
jgi:hypothetical protein